MRRNDLTCAIALLATLLAAPLALAAPPSAAVAADDPSVQLADFLAQFTALRSVRMEVQATIRLETPQGVRTGQGSFVYQEQGDLFRLRCETDRRLGLMDDVEYVFDGDRSLIWFLASNTVTANTSLLHEAPTALPNPFFLPLEFVVDLGACPQCRVSLAAVRRALDTGAPVLTPPATETRRSRATGALRLAPAARVELRQAAGLSVPQRITREVPERLGEMSVELGDYASFEGFVFPRTITLQALDGRARTAMRLDLVVREIEVDRPAAREAFSAIGDERSTFILSGDPERDVPVP